MGNSIIHLCEEYYWHPLCDKELGKDNRRWLTEDIRKVECDECLREYYRREEAKETPYTEWQVFLNSLEKV